MGNVPMKLTGKLTRKRMRMIIQNFCTRAMSVQTAQLTSMTRQSGGAWACGAGIF